MIWTLAQLLALLTFGFFALLVGGFFYLAYFFHQRQIKVLEAFAASLEGAETRLDLTLFGTPYQGWFVKGQRGERSIRLDFKSVRRGKHRYVYARFAVEVPHAIPTFQVTRTNLLNRVGRAVGLVADTKIGDHRIDEKYILQGDPSALHELFRQAPKLEWCFDDLFGNAGFKTIELSRGLSGGYQGFSAGSSWLQAELLVQGGLWAAKIEKAFETLARIADYCDRSPASSPRIKVSAQLETYAWSYGAGGARCPYCRDALNLAASSGAEITPCEGCGTIHHEECLREAGGCTVYGCERAARHGSAPTRAPNREPAEPVRPRGRRL